ncbi:MAG: MarR family transcriptional regulator [Halapricum sp.]
MNRKTTDAVVLAAVVAVLAGGGLLTWQAIQRRQTSGGVMDGMMMDGSTGTMTGTDPIVYAVGTLIAAALLVGLYAIIRESNTGKHPSPVGSGGFETTNDDAASNNSSGHGAAETPTQTDLEEPVSTKATVSENSASKGSKTSAATGEASAGNGQSASEVLDILPEDERRILEPVVDSPGLTQIALRDRSDFSKSKVSQTVSDLEKRGLLYREKQGRTYRVFPDDDLAGRTED